ncbi:hypothetical protein P154DRAFT_449135, partial [Amniculicola lignicola CBS 123094]
LADTPRVPSCAKCFSATPASGKLLRCSRCRAAFYCNTACQKADWSMHKKNCRRDSGGPSPSTSYPPTPLPSSPSAYQPPPTAAFPAMFGLELDLPSLDEKTVFTYLIDAYRLRVTDDFIFTGTIREHSLRSAIPEPIRDFQTFLGKAEKRTGVLPQWWNAERRAACAAFAAERAWQSINQEVDKADIIEKYADNIMPMRLRLLAEKVYGTPVTPYN